MKFKYMYIDTFYLHSGSLRNKKLDLPSEYSIGKMGLLILDLDFQKYQWNELFQNRF